MGYNEERQLVQVQLWFRHNLDIVFLLYGLSFVAMGVSILVQSRGGSALKLSRIIWLLASFALIHGINEWLDMLAFTHPAETIFKRAGFCCLVASFAFLFEFGLRLFTINKDVPWFRWRITAGMLICISVLSYVSGRPWETGQILARYFLAFPGSLLTAIGFYHYRYIKENIKKPLHVNGYFLLAGIAFLIYCVLGGLVVNRGGFFPSNVLNTETFLAAVKIPVQVFRAISATLAAISVVGVIKLFNWEAQKHLQDTIEELVEKEDKILQQAQLQEVLNLVMKVSMFSMSIEKQLERILNFILLLPSISLQAKGCIYLKQDNSDTLTIITHNNFPQEQLKVCANIQVGQCLCGRSAATARVIFVQTANDVGHDIRYEGMLPHGHYCIPIISDVRLIGVLNLYVTEQYQWSREEEGFFKSIANIIAEIIIRKETDERLKQYYQTQDTINTILQLSLNSFSLQEHMEKTLQIISSVPWLSNKSTGCIFLMDEKRETLVIKAHKGLSPRLYKTCNYLPLGKCLCGLAASTGEVVFADSLDARHSIVYEGMHQHGHYCVPIKSGDRVLGVINLYTKAGHVRTRQEENFLVSVASTLSGIIERKQIEDRLLYMTNYDTLTGLPNRVLLVDRLEYEIRNARRYGSFFAVFYLDMDNFKNVNDAMGHDVGDLFLKTIADRLMKNVREADTVARVNGDEFTLIMTNLKNTNALEAVANKILSSLSEHFDLGGNNYIATASLGISVYPDDADGAEGLISCAETAMNVVKLGGRNGCLRFNSEMDASMSGRFRLENDLRLAIERNELVLYYQPQIDIKSGRIIGAEALVRWQHPELGLIYPNSFIPLAENTGLIVPLGELVLRNGCQQNVVWQGMGLPSVIVAINVSLKQVHRQYNLAEVVLKTLHDTQLNPQYLELEFTESFYMQNLDNTIAMLRQFTYMGILVTIDDFGTGFSSLSYLKHLPFKKLKIDKGFIQEITTNPDDLTIVKTIIDMAHNLRLKVIAEGVETHDQLEVLRNLNCDEVQGFLFSKAIPAEAFAQMLKGLPV
ncbi:PAS/PAC and GAF sensor-containing diguanylate cyclase/phosphodiesterase [Candidatus Magnetobacterium bavaricum]|uniref:PAS/PAC and GAF sensor-containing diguanylate cyclase/phosphodiesterase n=1 Tax=Candidatus Magnetobacterium bavaricum TaxID=29290 RepID=A0A0F3GPP1_9BACT|nr:PAS/PAC and GAF sensor-containing diguanylate cyclase/phosphodiesterase [Candidatus Magnetobacterium bavaricum]